MSIIVNDKFQGSHLYLGVVNGSAKTFSRFDESRERNIQIIIVCIMVFAYSIVEDFLRGLIHVLRH